MKKNINDVDVKKMQAGKMVATPKRIPNNVALLLNMNNCINIYGKYILN